MCKLEIKWQTDWLKEKKKEKKVVSWQTINFPLT